MQHLDFYEDKIGDQLSCTWPMNAISTAVLMQIGIGTVSARNTVDSSGLYRVFGSILEMFKANTPAFGCFSSLGLAGGALYLVSGSRSASAKVLSTGQHLLAQLGPSVSPSFHFHAFCKLHLLQLSCISSFFEMQCRMHVRPDENIEPWQRPRTLRPARGKVQLAVTTPRATLTDPAPPLGAMKSLPALGHHQLRDFSESHSRQDQVPGGHSGARTRPGTVPRPRAHTRTTSKHMWKPGPLNQLPCSGISSLC